MGNVATANTIKRLEEQYKKAPEHVKPEVKQKINALKGNKLVQK